MAKIKLSQKQKKVILIIKEKGRWKHPVSDQNATVKKLFSLGVVEWNNDFTGLVLTSLGEQIEI